jgi:hypothetical protein
LRAGFFALSTVKYQSSIFINFQEGGSENEIQFDEFVAQISEMWQDAQSFNAAVLKYLDMK